MSEFAEALQELSEKIRESISIQEASIKKIGDAVDSIEQIINHNR